jgi:hypothetical protein
MFGPATKIDTPGGVDEQIPIRQISVGRFYHPINFSVFDQGNCGIYRASLTRFVFVIHLSR